MDTPEEIEVEIAGKSLSMQELPNNNFVIRKNGTEYILDPKRRTIKVDGADRFFPDSDAVVLAYKNAKKIKAPITLEDLFEKQNKAIVDGPGIISSTLTETEQQPQTKSASEERKPPELVDCTQQTLGALKKIEKESAVVVKEQEAFMRYFIHLETFLKEVNYPNYQKNLRTAQNYYCSKNPKGKEFAVVSIWAQLVGAMWLAKDEKRQELKAYVLSFEQKQWRNEIVMKYKSSWKEAFEVYAGAGWWPSKGELGISGRNLLKFYKEMTNGSI